MQYIPLKKRVALLRRHAEIVFSKNDLAHSIAISQQLDILIHYLLRLRSEQFYEGQHHFVGRRKRRFEQTRVAS